ncbi:MAG: histidine kinase [Lachnospiraceae bacterium]|nr:histidine kinase [Lachnospiraceae bacterium]
MRKEKHFHSIIYKNTLITMLVGISLFLIISLSAPTLFYLSAQKELTTYISGSVKECAVRLSYVLSNHRATLDLRRDSAFLDLIRDYYSEGADQSAILTEIQPYLSAQVDGHAGNGSIFSTNYTVIATGYGDYFCTEEDALLAQALEDSAILQNIQTDSDGNFSSDTYYIDVDGKCYTPVLTFDMEGTEVSYLCLIGGFLVDDIPCFAVSLTPFADIYAQMESLNEIGVSDFALICDGIVLFQNLEEAETAFSAITDFTVLPLSDQQYEISTMETDSGLTFFSLCSYASEELYLAANVTRTELIAPYTQFFSIQRMLLCILVLIMIGIFYIIFRLSLNRLKKMDQEMSQVRSGNFDIVLKDTNPDEIGSIARTINTMVSTIKTSLERQIASEKMEKEMQYSLLVSAIDPHFIYNTLDTITFLAAMGNCEDIIKVNNALIGTLKDRIKMTQLNVYDSVDNEKQVLDQYMIIQSYLYANPIDYRFTISEECHALQIPKNILQSLVENAIKHGLMPNKNSDRTRVRDGQILVSIEKQGAFILLSVSDNGVGMSEEQRNFYLSKEISAVREPEHIGILNLRLRLSYLYQDHFTFEIQCPKEGGTIVRIQLPL